MRPVFAHILAFGLPCLALGVPTLALGAPGRPAPNAAGVPAAAEVSAAAPGDAGASPATPEAKTRAEEAYRVGVGHFKAQRFEDAVIEFAKAYRLDPSPILVFNMARAFEELKRFDQAVKFYRRYLEVAPEAPDRGAVAESIAALEGLAAPASGAAGQAELASGGPGPWPWVVFGTGVALAGVGVAFGVLARDRAATLDEIEAAPSRFSRDEWAAARSDGQTFAVGADVLLSVGAAAAVGGLVWWFLADEGAQVGLAPAPGGLGLAGTF